MSTKVVIGHTYSENEEYVTVNKRSERPLSAVLGFVFGCLFGLLAIEYFSYVEVIFIVIASTLVGFVTATCQRSESIPKHRVIRIRKRWGKVAVDYVVYDNPVIDLLEK